MYLPGQRVRVPDPNATTPGATIEVTVIASTTRYTHYQGPGYKSWTYTPRVKPIPKEKK
jgi:hypothetical protein